MENTSDYIKLMAARLKQLDDQIRELEEFADKAIEAVKDDYRRQINDLFLKKADVQDKVNKVQEACGDVWEDMKAGTELSWEVLNDSVKAFNPKK
jgi:predicted ArsR family transcriptional regulator